MFSDELGFYLKASGGMRWVVKNEQYVVPRTIYIFIRLIVGERFQQNKSGFVFL